MKKIKIKNTGKIVFVEDYFKLTQSEQNNMVCIQCEKRSFYRRESCDGKEACFYARHETNCDIGTSKYYSENSPHHLKKLSKIEKINWNDKILYLKDSDSSEKKENSILEKRKKNNLDNHSNKVHVLEPSKEERYITTLEDILDRILEKRFDLLKEWKISLKNKTYPLMSFLTNVADLNSEDNKNSYGIKLVWGVFHNIQDKKFLNYLDENEKTTCTISLKTDDLKNFWKKRKVNYYKISTPVHFIAIARIFTPSEKNKKIVYVNNSNDIFILPEDLKENDCIDHKYPPREKEDSTFDI